MSKGLDADGGADFAGLLHLFISFENATYRSVLICQTTKRSGF